MQFGKFSRYSVTGVLALLLAVPAQAQEGVGASSPGDIIVTARKRQESVLKVPVVQSVLTAESLAKAAIVDVGGVTRNLPGLGIGGGGGRRSDQRMPEVDSAGSDAHQLDRFGTVDRGQRGTHLRGSARRQPEISVGDHREQKRQSRRDR